MLVLRPITAFSHPATQPQIYTFFVSPMLQNVVKAW